MGQPPVAVAAVRLAVRRSLADLPAGSLVLVACSGGADSLALAAATAFLARSAPWRAGLVTVDHGLQPGSAEQAERVRGWAASVGFDPVEVRRVDVGTHGGPEGAARTARYTALDAVVEEHRAAAVLLGHTLDDQAETVLLALARGSGARSLSGMAPVRGHYRRPLLCLARAVTLDACAAEGLDPWADPHNADNGFTRVRVRAVLRSLEEAAPGARAGLARSADLLRVDADSLEATAAKAAAGASGTDGTLDCAALAALQPAVRTRILRAAALDAGVPAGALTSVHIGALDALVTAWSGQGPVSLPGGVQGMRASGRLVFAGR
ncbi:MAG: tRNA lysidine(34) synthetase TilS [Actinomycetota bacterium]|nr:tRNA lysidine(34) synthetase TilS [Actinomycetota bacterium]